MVSIFWTLCPISLNTCIFYIVLKSTYHSNIILQCIATLELKGNGLIFHFHGALNFIYLFILDFLFFSFLFFTKRRHGEAGDERREFLEINEQRVDERSVGEEPNSTASKPLLSGRWIRFGNKNWTPRMRISCEIGHGCRGAWRKSTKLRGWMANLDEACCSEEMATPPSLMHLCEHVLASLLNRGTF